MSNVSHFLDRMFRTEKLIILCGKDLLTLYHPHGATSEYSNDDISLVRS